MLDLLVTFLASFLIWLMFLGLFVLWVIDGKAKKELALHSLFATTIAWVATLLVKYFFPTLRPFALNPDKLPMTITYPTDSAFPSTHTAVAFAIATAVLLHNKKIGILFFVCAFLVGLGRVFANVHFPSDIIAGASVGILTAWGVGKSHFFGVFKR